MSIAKKPRFDSAAQKYLQPRILTDEFKKKLKKEISGSKPYEHGIIQGLLDDELLRNARKEIFDNLHFTEKETDIYKLVQTGDLLNFDGLPENEIALLQSVLKVRNALYSQEFRDIMSYVTGCGPLSGTKFDLSLNNYNRGCHLLAHDDVIGTRVISFILYLVSPDYKWNPKWGGALQLYPTLAAGIPQVDHSVSVSPQWNQLSFFKIIPGHSFHDVEEVYIDDSRLSIQGWFHVPQEGESGYKAESENVGNGYTGSAAEDRTNSTLSQLLQAHYANIGYEPKRVFKLLQQIRDIDSAYLAKYIRSDVLDDTSSLQKQFLESSILTIADFLSKKFWSRVSSEINEMELSRCPLHLKQVPENWAVASPPHLRRYCYLKDAENERTALHELKELFQSPQFAKLLADMTGVTPKSEYVELRRFRPGRDYTLAGVSGVDTDILETMLSVTTAKWETDVGGYDLVMNGGHDENDDPAIYRQSSEDDDSVLLSNIPTRNELVIIMRDPDLLRFIKYVSKNAHGSRWDVFGQYEIEDDDDNSKNQCEYM